MHYHAEVWVSKPDNIERQVTSILEKHQEKYNEETEESSGFWDWWQIGGRWTGSHDSYNPEKDPANIEICNLCQGTGLRNDELGKNARLENPSYTCNGCQGNGKRVKWPTHWKQYQGDIIPVEEVSDKLTCHTLVLPDLEVLHTEEWNSKDFVSTGFSGNVKENLEKHNVKYGYLVTVDYHS